MSYLLDIQYVFNDWSYFAYTQTSARNNTYAHTLVHGWARTRKSNSSLHDSFLSVCVIDSHWYKTGRQYYMKDVNHTPIQVYVNEFIQF